MIQKILTGCIGNLCRSPMAEALFREALKNKQPQVTVSSFGVAALIDYPADNYAIELMQQQGIDLSLHRARQLSPALLFEADIILMMTLRQKNELEENFPSLCGRVHCLGHWGDYDIPDPYRGSKEAFINAHILIKQGVDDWMLKVFNTLATSSDITINHPYS
jgi:protein-tyrosine phosphatase